MDIENRAMTELKMIYAGDYTKGAIGYCAEGRWKDWIFWKHPDGQWVSIAKIPDRRDDTPPQTEDYDRLYKAAIQCEGDLQLVRKCNDEAWKEVDRLRALQSHPAKPQDVPAGWKLVPVEPTEVMLDKAFYAFDDDMTRKGNCKSIYRAMLTAAPDAGGE